MRIRALDDRAVDLADPASPRPLDGRRCRVVGIDGMSGSGKSSFAHRLAGELAAPADEWRRRLELRPDWATYAPLVERWTRQEAALQATADTPGRADLVVDNSDKRGAGGWVDQFAAPPGRWRPGLVSGYKRQQ